MNSFPHAERVHRLVKEALDRGTVGSLDEAELLFASYRLTVEVTPAAATSPVHQIMALTAVALGRRVFLGGVWVRLAGDAPLNVPLPLAPTLGAAVAELGGRVSDETVASDTPNIVIGGTARRSHVPFDVRAIARGWRGGIVTAESPDVADEGAMPLAAMLAAALAVNEAFLYVRRENAAAGHRSVGLSLWRPHDIGEWLRDDLDEPVLALLPSRLWLLGLGHLGQAFLWALGLLPYPHPTELALVLQDVDVITPSTESTSILSDKSLAGRMKTRAMAFWAERRGFSTSIHERRFGSGFNRQEEEPAILLCGIDNALGRRALDGAGFDLVVEAGLGRGHQDFRSLRMHTLPGRRTAAQIWPHRAAPTPEVVTAPYQKLVDDGVLDRCGMTLLAGKAVGAPFVGAVAATLVVSEVLRLLHDGVTLELMDLNLQWPEYRETVLQCRDFSGLNPGYVRAA